MGSQKNDEYHVASYVISTRRGNESQIAEAINRMDGVEVHANGNGKLVVTAEAGSVRDLAAIADELAAVEHVVNVAPVYHEYAAAAQNAT